MSYAVKEIFYSLQGEGANVGRACVFCRFTGCNLWSGFEADRERAVCQFCDTHFVGTDGTGGGTFPSAAALADAIALHWPADAGGRPFTVLTGGEPTLQVDEALVQACHARGFEIAIETNGTRPVVPGLDWVTVSPKAGAPLVVHAGQELKLVYPQEGLDPAQFESLAFGHFFLQPMYGPQVESHRSRAVEYCLRHPRWRLSLQVHRILGLR